MIPDTPMLAEEIEQLCATARSCFSRGWVPATSGNFSVRSGRHFFITPTGIEKGTVKPDDLLEVNFEGRVIAGNGSPSAETSLHAVIYGARIEALAILHVHTIWNTLLSGRFLPNGHVPLEGYELLKGLSGVHSHDHIERVPILENAQDYRSLAEHLDRILEENPAAHGVLLSRHGLYTWGESVAQARRHLEALEFLFEVEGRRLFGQPV